MATLGSLGEIQTENRNAVLIKRMHKSLIALDLDCSTSAPATVRICCNLTTYDVRVQKNGFARAPHRVERISGKSVALTLK